MSLVPHCLVFDFAKRANWIYDKYRVHVFLRDTIGIDGNILNPRATNPQDPHRMSDRALQWHFGQAVLMNMKGMGEEYPDWEFDFSRARTS